MSIRSIVPSLFVSLYSSVSRTGAAPSLAVTVVSLDGPVSPSVSSTLSFVSVTSGVTLVSSAVRPLTESVADLSLAPAGCETESIRPDESEKSPVATVVSSTFSVNVRLISSTVPSPSASFVVALERSGSPAFLPLLVSDCRSSKLEMRVASPTLLSAAILSPFESFTYPDSVVPDASASS